MTIRGKIVLISLAGILAFSGCGPRRSQTVPEPEMEPFPVQPVNTLMVKQPSLENKLTWDEFQEVKIESYADASYFAAQIKYDKDKYPNFYLASPKKTIEDGWIGVCRNRALVAALVLEKLGYEPIILSLYGNRDAHMVALVEEKTDSGIKYGYVDGENFLEPCLDSIEEIVAEVNCNNLIESGAQFTKYRKRYLNNAKKDWRFSDGDLLPYVDPERYKINQQFKEWEKGTDELNKKIENSSKSTKNLQNLVNENGRKLHALIEKTEELNKEIMK